jgi:hypothetical protein
VREGQVKERDMHGIEGCKKRQGKEWRKVKNVLEKVKHGRDE